VFSASTGHQETLAAFQSVYYHFTTQQTAAEATAVDELAASVPGDAGQRSARRAAIINYHVRVQLLLPVMRRTQQANFALLRMVRWYSLRYVLQIEG